MRGVSKGGEGRGREGGQQGWGAGGWGTGGRGGRGLGGGDTYLCGDICRGGGSPLLVHTPRKLGRSSCRCVSDLQQQQQQVEEVEMVME